MGGDVVAARCTMVNHKDRTLPLGPLSRMRCATSTSCTGSEGRTRCNQILASQGVHLPGRGEENMEDNSRTFQMWKHLYSRSKNNLFCHHIFLKCKFYLRVERWH